MYHKIFLSSTIAVSNIENYVQYLIFNIIPKSNKRPMASDRLLIFLNMLYDLLKLHILKENSKCNLPESRLL